MLSNSTGLKNVERDSGGVENYKNTLKARWRRNGTKIEIFTNRVCWKIKYLNKTL